MQCKLLVLPLVISGAIGATSAVHANACDAVYQVGFKSMQAPHHVYTTTAHGGRTVEGEAIHAGGVEALRRRGKWMRSPIPQPEMIAAAKEKMKTDPDPCTLIGDQNAGSQAMTPYKVHDNEYGFDSQVRVLESSGLVQGEPTHSPGGVDRETRHEYDNVSAPEGVH